MLYGINRVVRGEGTTALPTLLLVDGSKGFPKRVCSDVLL